MTGGSISDWANGVLIVIVGLLSYFGIRRGQGANEAAPANPSTIEVAGALVDSRSVDKLSGEVAGQSIAIMTQTQAMKDQTRAIEANTRMMEDLKEDVSRAVTDLATQIARRH